MGINDNYVKALTKMASDPVNQEAYRQRVATIQADMQRVREQEVLADFNQWKADNGVVDVPQPKAPVMKSVDELRKPTREDNRKLANDQRIKETLERKKNAKAINAARTVEQVNKNLANYVQKKQAENAVLKQNKGRDEYTRRQEERKQKLEAATPVTTPEQTTVAPVSNYLTGNAPVNTSTYNNTGVSIAQTSNKKAKAAQKQSTLVKDMSNTAEVDNVVNQWLAKDKLTGAEKKQAQKIYQQKKHELDLASSDWYRTMSTADATKKYNEELQKIEPLNLKSRGSMPFNYGLFSGLGANRALQVEGKVLSKVTGDKGYEEAFNGANTLADMARKENGVGYGAGALTGELVKNAAEYGVANQVIGASRLGQSIKAGTRKLPGGKYLGDAYANLATGQLADTLIDTPRTIAYNAMDGKYIDENGNVDMAKVMADIGINQAVNLGFNTAFGVGDVVRGLKARNVAKKESKEAFRDLLDTTTRNTPEAVAREEADLLAQAKAYGEARQIAEANNAKVQLQTPEATAREEADLLAQARAMGERRSALMKNSVDNEGKLAHNEGIKERADYGNGGIIKETGTEEAVRRGGLQNNETLGNDSRAYGRDSVGPEGTEIYSELSRGRTQGSGNSTVSTGVVVRDNVRKAMDEQGISDMGLKDSSGNYSRYSEALSSARKANEHGAFVDSKAVDELTERGAKTYLNDEGTAGVAVMNDGNIVGVFKHPSDTRKGASTDLVITARENGGDRLDCYGDVLVRKYSECGFEPVARVKYEYGINPEMDSYMKLKKSENPNFKEPEIYFMKVRDGESVEDSLKALSNASSPIYTRKQLSELPLMDYEAAEAYRDSLIEQAKQSSANNTAFSMRKNNADRLATDVKSFANRTELKKASTVAETKEPVPTLTATPQKEEKPFKDALDSRLTKDGEVERSFAMNTRVGKVEGIPKEVQQQFMDEPAMYKQLKNADTVANATKAREEAGDIEKAYNTFKRLLEQKDPQAVVMGHQLAKEYSAMGDYDRASTVIRETAKELTKAGQFTQAAAISMMKNDPMTARAYLEKEIDALNREAKERFGDGFENFKLSNDEKEMFNDIKPGDTKALKEAYDKVGARLGREYPVTLWKKVTEGRHLAMLFNPRTHIRNTVANVLLLPQRTVSNRVNAVLEKGMSAINKDFDVSQSLKGGSKSQKAVGDYLYKTEVVNALENAQKYVEDIGGKGGSKLSDYAKDADVFKGTALSHWLNKKTNGRLAEAVKKMGGNGAESMLELLRRMDYKALDVEDQIFVKRNFVDRLASYMDAKGIKPSEEVLEAMKTGNNKEVIDQFLAEIPPEGVSIALDEALKATFKDDNAFTKMLVNLKKNLGPAGELIMPFTKTPANLAVRAYDYSPAGAVHGIVKAVKSKDVQGIRNGLDRLSKGLTGTGMLAAGYALRQSGLITGNYDSDKDKKQQQIKEGYKPYAIHLGDKYYTYDWAEPASSALVMASEIYDAMNDGKEETNAVAAGGKAIQTGVDTWVNSSPLSSFADLMGSGSVSSSVGERAMENVLNFPGSFVPAAVSATAKVSDTTQRNTYDPNNPLKSAVNQTIAKIPELSKTLPAKYDTWGNEVKRYNSKGEAAFANYLNPGVYSSEKHTPIDDAIEKLYDETGDNGVFPLTAEYKIKLDAETEKKLSPKEQSEYQKTMGQASYKMVSDFLKSDNVKGLDPGEQVDVIHDMYSFSKALAQKDLVGKEIKDSSLNKAYTEYENAGGGDKGLKAVAKYYENKALLNKEGLENNEHNQALINKGGVKAVKQEADMRAALKEAGLQNNEKNRELYKTGGEKALKDKADKSATLKEYDYKEGTKAAEVYDEKGEEGLKVLTETKSKLESGNQTTSVKNAMNYLDKQSMSDEDKGYYLSQSMSNMGGKAKAYVDKGDYEGFYEYEQKRTAADGDKNGTLKKSEVTDYLDSQNMTASQKKFWFEQLGQKKWKNPYK